MGQMGDRNGTEVGQNVDSGQKRDKSRDTDIDKEHRWNNHQHNDVKM